MATTYIAVDLETTGLDAGIDAIIEVAAVTFREREILDEWSSLVNPYQQLPPFITKLTGITQKMVEDAPDMATLRPEIKRILGDNVIVGHNISFDLGFLRAENLALGSHRVDTLTLASILMPTAGRYGLSALSDALDLPRPAGDRDHRALDDARRTALLFFELQERALDKGFSILSEIVEAGRNMGWPETIFFEDALRAAGRDAFGRTERLERIFKVAKPEGRQLIPAEPPEPIAIDEIAGMLQPGGNFSRLFPNYEYRIQQVEML